MFPKAARLSRTKDIEKVFKGGQTKRHQLFLIKYLPNSLNQHRVTVVAGLRISKKAVIRNQLKRRLRAILQEQLKTIETKYDLMVICQPSCVNQSFDQLAGALTTVLKLL